GVRQAGVADDGGVQVGVAAPPATGLSAGDLSCVIAVFAVHAPAAAVGNLAGLLYVEVDHVPGPAGDDPLRFPVVLAGGVEEPAAVQAEVEQVAADGAHRDRDALGG